MRRELDRPDGGGADPRPSKPGILTPHALQRAIRVLGYDGRVTKFFVLAFLVVLGALATLAAAIGGPGWWVLLAIVVLLLGVATYDVLQKRHSILRNYPLLGHMRFRAVAHSCGGHRQTGPCPRAAHGRRAARARRHGGR